MPRPRLLLPGVVAVALSTPAAPAHAKPIDVPGSVGSVLQKVDARTRVAVLLPDSLDLDHDGRVYASGTGRRRAYSVSLAAAPGCRGATACFPASFTARRGGKPAYRSRVRLRRGVPGWFQPMTCGLSCAPPGLQFRQRGILYEIVAKLRNASAAGQRRALVRAANEALRAGTRR